MYGFQNHQYLHPRDAAGEAEDRPHRKTVRAFSFGVHPSALSRLRAAGAAVGCLSYAPRELPSEDLYWLCEYLRDCQANGTEQDAEFIHGMLQQIRELLILPGRDA